MNNISFFGFSLEPLILFLSLIMFLAIFGLSCFVSANPWEDMIGTKAGLMDNFPKQYILPYQVIKVNDPPNLVDLDYPVVMKPNFYNGKGKNVSIIRNSTEAKNYLNKIAKLNREIEIDQEIVVQKFHPGPYEVGILWERYPHQMFTDKPGRIVSIVEKREINSDPKFKNLPRSYYGLKRAGDAFYNLRDRPEWITTELTQTMNQIAETFPNFYAGRYDIRFSELDKFLKGQDFKIVELNGADGEDLRAYLAESSTLKKKIVTARTLGVRMIMGLENILLGQSQSTWTNICNVFKFLKYLLIDSKRIKNVLT